MSLLVIISIVVALLVVGFVVGAVVAVEAEAEVNKNKNANAYPWDGISDDLRRIHNELPSIECRLKDQWESDQKCTNYEMHDDIVHYMRILAEDSRELSAMKRTKNMVLLDKRLDALPQVGQTVEMGGSSYLVTILPVLGLYTDNADINHATYFQLMNHESTESITLARMELGIKSGSIVLTSQQNSVNCTHD